MTRLSIRTSRRSQLAIEALEDRAIPATFGVPWGDPGHLTLSFVPDGTPIAGHVSALSATLDPQMSAPSWQSTILRAFQTWAVNANINIGLTTDNGAPLGAAGPVQHDPRFGDVRVGAQAMGSESLSVTVPYDFALSGTWAGDVLFNSNAVFDGKTADLFSVALHEAGHVFGLDESSDPKSPLFSNLNFATSPTSADIMALQALYGIRSPDLYEGSSSNDSISKATSIPQPSRYRGATPQVVFGDVTTSGDVDVYAVRPPSGYQGPVTFRLQSAGLSLLTTQLTVTDAQGNIYGQAQAASDFGDTVSVTLPNSDPNPTYFLKVQAASKDVFGIGSYGLAVSYDSASVVTPAALDHFLRTAAGPLNQNDVAAALLSPGGTGTPIRDDHHSDDSTLSATVLTTTPGFATGSHYQAIGGLNDTSDVDFYRLVSRSMQGNTPLVMTATVRSLTPAGVLPQIRIFDRDGAAVSSRILANGNGTFTIQAVGVKSGSHVFVEVLSDGTVPAIGNYALDVSFGTVAADLQTFAADTVAPAATQAYHLYVAESQLFQFLLSAAPVGVSVPGSSVRMSLVNATGVEVFGLVAAVGQTVGGPALFLTPGAYTIRYTTLMAGGNPGPAMSYTLYGESLSDPIGPKLTDPTLAPIYAPPTRPPGSPPIYIYPGNISSSRPFLITQLG